VCRQAHQVGAEGGDIDPDYAQRFRGIGVKDYPRRLAYRRDLPQRLRGADLIIDRHYRDKRHAFVDDGRDRARIYDTVGADRDSADLESPFSRRARRSQDTFVLDRADHDAPPLPRGRACNPEHREIVCFRRSRGEDDFVSIGPNQRRYLRAGDLDRSVRVPSEGMIGGVRIPIHHRPIGLHCLNHARVSGRGGLIAHINTANVTTLVHSDCLSVLPQLPSPLATTASGA
jgi:hypothetical protein